MLVYFHLLNINVKITHMRIYSTWMVILLFGLTTTMLHGQIDIREKIRQKSMERVERKVDESIDRTLDQVEGKDEAEAEQKKDEVAPAEPTDRQKPPVAATQQKTPLSVYSKYDFVPGERVLFFDDFSQDNVGDFPALWNTSKGGEVMMTNNYPGHWFMIKEDGMVILDKGFKFPENFTLEFDVIPVRLSEECQSAWFDLTLLSSDEEGLFPKMYVPGRSGIALNLADQSGAITYATYSDASYIHNGEYAKPEGLLKAGELNHVAIWVQKTRFRLYLHGEKVFDIPRALQPGHQYDQIRFTTAEDSYPLITNVRIADAAPDLRSKLLTEGKLVTRGITFDSGSDVIKPESYAVLKEIAQVLKENPSLKVRIIGHTDSDGSDASNLELSKKRAAAVKKALAGEFSIDNARMETDGKGESEPAGPNTTPEGKANNRRVEFVKI